MRIVFKRKRELGFVSFFVFFQEEKRAIFDHLKNISIQISRERVEFFAVPQADKAVLYDVFRGFQIIQYVIGIQQ